MTGTITGRALHWVFKVGNRKETMRFYRDVLGMKVLRHEEFEEGCKASCNGPYDGKWSKTMVGYGPEDNYFVVELTYNYGIGSYNLGNDFLGITIKSSEAIKNAEALKWPMTEEGGLKCVKAPGGYKFFLMNEPQPLNTDPVQKVSIASTNLHTSIEYWNQLLGMKISSSQDTTAELTYGQTSLELIKTDSINHGTAFGRIAFAVDTKQLPSIQAAVESKGFNVLTPLVKLDTPGKATVEVVIIADPDGHEICFVGDEAFKELSQPDPKGDFLLDEAMEKDKSEEWFAKKGKTKGTA